MKTEVEILKAALMLACERIADGPQEYHEANTPDGWARVYIEHATNDTKHDPRP